MVGLAVTVALAEDLQFVLVLLHLGNLIILYIRDRLAEPLVAYALFVHLREDLVRTFRHLL